MNPPEHGAFRSVVNRRFTPRAIEQLRAQIEEVTTEVLDGALGANEGDFVTTIAAKLPLAVISGMFNIRRQDWPMMSRLSNQLVGPEDPEYNKSASSRESVEQARMEFFQYFSKLIEDRSKSRPEYWWCAYGVGQANDITVEINFPVAGINRRIAGAFAEDGHGYVYLLHNGAVHRSRPGPTRQTFLNYYENRGGRLETVRWGFQDERAIVIGRLGDRDFAHNVARFVHATAEFKVIP